MTVPAGSGARRPRVLKRVALGLHLVPDAELAEDPQGVALQGDSRPEGLRGVGLLQDFHLDSGVGQEDGGGQSRGSRPDDSDVLYCCHR